LKGIPAYEKMLEKIKEPLDERVSTWSRYCILLILFAKSDFSYCVLIQNRFTVYPKYNRPGWKVEEEREARRGKQEL
jgi:hypothetical protein